MMRYFFILCASLLSLSVHSFQWQDLWSTSDQQGRDLMANNQFKEATETFKRTDWAAAAAYRAKEYQKAAELYNGLHDKQSNYNQGNALAHLGRYEEAIKAYNNALSINPKNKDALDNRRLVEALLKQNQQNKDQKNKDQQNKDQQNKDQQNKDQQNKDQQNKDQQNKDQQNKDQQNKDQQNKDQQNKDQQNKDQQNKDQQNKDQQNKEQQNKEQQNKEQQNKDQQNKDQRNSEAAREKQQAKEQWLRLIPDDPGGLMREKFLRDHIRRQRGWYQ